VARILKIQEADVYGTKVTHRQEAMVASAIDEPRHNRVVRMLEALPSEDQSFYAAEENVFDPVGKSTVIAKELEERFGFLGG